MLRLPQRIHSRAVVRPTRPRQGERRLCAVLSRYCLPSLFLIPFPSIHFLPSLIPLRTTVLVLTNRHH